MDFIRSDKTKVTFSTILEVGDRATTFRHFKGNLYKIVGIAKDSETLEEIVIYQGQYADKPLWTRTITDFFSDVDKNKYPEVIQKYRFEKVD